MEDILREGAKGVQVRGAQQLLNERVHPIPRLALDGDFGPRTQAAVLLFQHQRTLLEDGEIGDDTWRALSGAPQRKPSPKSAGPIASANVVSTTASEPFRPTLAQPVAAASPIRATATPKPPPISRAGPLDIMIAAHPEAPWMRVAAAELGIHERSITGTARILQYHRASTM